MIRSSMEINANCDDVHVIMNDDSSSGNGGCCEGDHAMMMMEKGKNVVVVMDALREFSGKPLEWTLQHVVEPGDVITLLGVMPWLSFPRLCKTWLDIWTLDPRDLCIAKERTEWKNDPKHQRLRFIVDLCEARGVVPVMKVAMGHPVRLLVLEQTTNLHASWVVFDRFQEKRRSFYRKKIPCNMVMLKRDGHPDFLRVRQSLESREHLTPKLSLPLEDGHQWDQHQR